MEITFDTVSSQFFQITCFPHPFLLIDIDKGCRSGRFGLDGTKILQYLILILRLQFQSAYRVPLDCIIWTVIVVLLVLVRCYWDTSLVTNMSHAFSQYPDFNADISGWDTSNVVDMSAMFESASCLTKTLARGHIE